MHVFLERTGELRQRWQDWLSNHPSEPPQGVSKFTIHDKSEEVASKGGYSVVT
jgi:hypothetical protein